MSYRTLTCEDQEALRRVVSRSGLTWTQLRFLTRLIASMDRTEVRDYQVMQDLAPSRSIVGRLPHVE